MCDGLPMPNITGVLGGMNVGLAAALGCIVSTAQAKQKASITSTRWEPLLGTANYANNCALHSPVQHDELPINETPAAGFPEARLRSSKSPCRPEDSSSRAPNWLGA